MHTCLAFITGAETVNCFPMKGLSINSNQLIWKPSLPYYYRIVLQLVVIWSDNVGDLQWGTESLSRSRPNDANTAPQGWKEIGFPPKCCLLT